MATPPGGDDESHADLKRERIIRMRPMRFRMLALAALCAGQIVLPLFAASDWVAATEEGNVMAGEPCCDGQLLADSCNSACCCGQTLCDGCGPAGCCDDRWYLFPQSDCGINFSGWINAGFIGNTDGPSSKFNGPYNGVDRSNELMLNQAYLVAEKSLPTGCYRGIGGRIDLLYGEDYFLADSVGFETRDDGSAHWNPEYYGLAIPQAYVDIGSQRLSLRVGHFYSVVGYEGVMAPYNFFYSKSYSYQFAGPFTHWGGQVNWNPNDCWEFNVGLVNGWDALDREEDRAAAIARAKYTHQPTGIWTSFAIITGEEFNNAAGLQIQPDTANRTRYSWLVDLPLSSRLEYVFHHWLGFQDDGAVGGGRADWYGIDQYLYYTVNDCWKVGARFEWFQDEEGTRVGLNRPSNPNKPPFPGDFFSVSLGLNWKPTANLTLRPEIRADWYEGSAAPLPYDDGQNDSQLMIGLDGIVLF